MKTKTSFTLHGCLLAAAILFQPLSAQQASVDENNNEAKEKELVVLSPFEVNADKDTGYQATSTLAGTRLNTPIKDLAASISIYTKDFLNDLSLTNTSDLLVYATGMEAAGANGNFSGAASDISSERPTGDSARVDPQPSSRARGLASPTYTRGYFPTSMSLDSYNVDSYTVNRGPNAALFGTASPAGVVDATLSPAKVDKDSSKLTVRYGNNDAWRHSLDLNRVLVPGKLGVRVSLLEDDEKYNQHPAFSDQKRIYGALTFEPYKYTSFRANFESGNTYANRPITVPPYNSISDYWYAAGRPSYDSSYYDDPDRNPNAKSQIAGPNTIGTVMGTSYVYGPIVAFADPSGPATDVFFWRTLSSASTPNNIGSSVYNPLVNKDLASDHFQFFTTTNVFNLPATFWTGDNVPPGQQPGYVPAGIKAQSFSDYSAFDWKNHMIDETSRQGDSFHSFNVAFSQRGWNDRLGVELVYDRQRVDRWSKNSFFGDANSTHIFVDVNEVLPNGQPNPNVGRPFASMNWPSWRKNFDDREGKRATGFAKYDFADLNAGWGKWLGRHTLSAVYEENAHDQVYYSYGLAAEGIAAETSDAGNINASYRRPDYLVYMGPSIIGNNNPLRLEPIRTTFAAGPTIPMSYFVRQPISSDPGHFERGSTTMVEINHGGQASREVIKSQALVLQSYWLQENVITTLGWRRDEDYYARESIAFKANPDDRNDPGQVHYDFNDFAFPATPPPNVAAETKSYGVVVRWPRNLVRLPAGTDFSVFYNNSANFTPIGGRIDPYNNPLPPPKGETREYGLNLSAFDGKLVMRLNHFKTEMAGVSSAPSFFASAIKSMITTPALSWVKEANTNPTMAAQSKADLDLLLSALPSNYLDLYDFQTSGTAPNIVSSVNTSAIFPTDTLDYTAKGWEADITYNPTKHWRILANVAQQQTVQTNSYPNLKEFLARMTPVWDQLKDRPLGNYPPDFMPGDTLPASVLTYGQYLDTNTLVPYASAIATEGSASAEQREWRVNLVTNYSFGSDSIFRGALNGWGIGAAVRWQSKLGLGYPSSRNPDGSVDFDIDHPFYAPAQTNGDVWLSYSRKLPHNIRWSVQLNVRNAIGSQDLVGVTVQSWNGEVAQYRLPPERRWYLTNTFSF